MSADEEPEDLDAENWLRFLRSEDESVRETAQRQLLEHVATAGWFVDEVHDVWLEFRTLHQRGAEDDFRQNAFRRVEVRIGKLKAGSCGQLRRWVERVIRSAALDEYRRVRGRGFLPNRWDAQVGAVRSNESQPAIDPTDPGTGPLTAARRKDLYGVALIHLQDYPEVDRAIVRLHAECDLTFAEITAELTEAGLVGPGREHAHLGRFQVARIYYRVLVELRGKIGSMPSKI